MQHLCTRFAVNFRSRGEEKLIFTLSAEERRRFKTKKKKTRQNESALRRALETSVIQVTMTFLDDTWHRDILQKRQYSSSINLNSLLFEDDPLAIAAALMPRGQRSSLAGKPSIFYLSCMSWSSRFGGDVEIVGFWLFSQKKAVERKN